MFKIRFCLVWLINFSTSGEFGTNSSFACCWRVRVFFFCFFFWLCMLSVNYDWRKIQLGKPQPLRPNSSCWFKITGQKSFQQVNQNSTLNLREYFRIGCKISAVRLPQVQSHVSLSLYSYFTNRMGRTTALEVNWQNLAATWAQVPILG